MFHFENQKLTLLFSNQKLTLPLELLLHGHFCVGFQKQPTFSQFLIATLQLSQHYLFVSEVAVYNLLLFTPRVQSHPSLFRQLLMNFNRLLAF